eukprot:148856-Amphidinium_carterae.1
MESNSSCHQRQQYQWAGLACHRLHVYAEGALSIGTSTNAIRPPDIQESWQRNESASAEL